MVQDLKDYFTELATPLKTVFKNQEALSAIKEEKIARLKGRLIEAVQTAHVLSCERRVALVQANQFYNHLDAHIDILKEFPKEFPKNFQKELPKDGSFDINELCKKIMYTIYVDVMLNETGTEFYKLITAQVGLHPKTMEHKSHLDDKKVELMYDMALVAITDGTCDGLVTQIEKRIQSLEEMKAVINNLQIVYKREPLNKKVIKPLQEIKENYWTPLSRKRILDKEDEELIDEALEELLRVEKDLKIIQPRLENALKENSAKELWKSITNEEHLLQSLQYCASLKWYERKQDLTGHGFTYNVDFDVAVRDRSRQRRIAIEQTSGLLGESGFDLHKKERHAKDIPVYWEKEVLFGGKAIADGDILLDSGANTQFLTKDTDTGLHPLIDEEANLEFLESHYHNNRHKDSNMIDSDEYEEYLRFKAGQRQQNSRHHYVFNW